MYCRENENETIRTLTYEQTTSTLESTQSHTVSLQTIAYEGLIAEYTIPINFMVGLLEISASKDFVNSFIDMATQKTNIILRLKDMQNRTEVKTEKKYTREIEVKGVRNYVAEITKWKPVEGNTENYILPGTGVSVGDVTTSVLDSGKTKVSYQLEGLPGKNPGDGSSRTLTEDAHDEYFVVLRVEGIDSVKKENWMWSAGTSETYKANAMVSYEFSAPNEAYWKKKFDVVETTKKNSCEKQYALEVNEITTWYGNINTTSLTVGLSRGIYKGDVTKTNYRKISSVDISSDTTLEGWLDGHPDSVNWSETSNAVTGQTIQDETILNDTKVKDSEIGEKAALNRLYNQTIDSFDERTTAGKYGAKKADYKKTEMTILDSSATETTVSLKYEKKPKDALAEAPTRSGNLKSNNFLGLLRNSTRNV